MHSHFRFFSNPKVISNSMSGAKTAFKGQCAKRKVLWWLHAIEINADGVWAKYLSGHIAQFAIIRVGKSSQRFAGIQIGKERQFEHLYLEKVFVNLRNSLEAAVTQVIKRSGLEIDYAVLRAAHKPHDRSAIEAGTQLDLRSENLRRLLQINSIAHCC